jgi:hypothetical protein
MHAPKGETPVAYVVGGARRKLSMISTVTNQGKTSWMIIDDNPNHVRLIEFFEALIKQAGRRFFLVLDNLGVHHCKPAKEWLAVHVKHIEVFCLPSYSPELNSDERLNGDETAAWIAGTTGRHQNVAAIQSAPEPGADSLIGPRAAGDPPAPSSA